VRPVRASRPVPRPALFPFHCWRRVPACENNNINVRKVSSPGPCAGLSPFPFHCWRTVLASPNSNINVRKIASHGPWAGVINIPVSLLAKLRTCWILKNVTVCAGEGPYTGGRRRCCTSPFHCWPHIPDIPDDTFLSGNPGINKPTKRH